MAVTMNMIKELREKTGAGVIDVKKALEENQGDIVKAEAWIKTQGLAKAESKSDRETAQGVVYAYVHHNNKSGALVKLLCETDFVARTDDFKNLAHEIALQVTSMQPKDMAELLSQAYVRDPQITIDDLIKSVSGKVGENIRLENFTRLSI